MLEKTSLSNQYQLSANIGQISNNEALQSVFTMVNCLEEDCL